MSFEIFDEPPLPRKFVHMKGLHQPNYIRDLVLDEYVDSQQYRLDASLFEGEEIYKKFMEYANDEFKHYLQLSKKFGMYRSVLKRNITLTQNRDRIHALFFHLIGELKAIDDYITHLKNLTEIIKDEMRHRNELFLFLKDELKNKKLVIKGLKFGHRCRKLLSVKDNADIVNLLSWVYRNEVHIWDVNNVNIQKVEDPKLKRTLSLIQLFNNKNLVNKILKHGGQNYSLKTIKSKNVGKNDLEIRESTAKLLKGLRSSYKSLIIKIQGAINVTGSTKSLIYKLVLYLLFVTNQLLKKI